MTYRPGTEDIEYTGAPGALRSIGRALKLAASSEAATVVYVTSVFAIWFAFAVYGTATFMDGGSSLWLLWLTPVAVLLSVMGFILIRESLEGASRVGREDIERERYSVSTGGEP